MMFADMLTVTAITMNPLMVRKMDSTWKNRMAVFQKLVMKQRRQKQCQHDDDQFRRIVCSIHQGGLGVACSLPYPLPACPPLLFPIRKLRKSIAFYRLFLCI